MNDELVNEVLRRLDSLGETIADGAIQGFEVLVRQVYISAVGDGVAALGLALFAAFILWSGRWARARVRANEERRGPRVDDDLPRGWGYAVSWAVATLVAAAGIFHLHKLIAKLVNPEFYAIKMILDVFS